MHHYLPLLGVLVVVAGFALRFNPVPVVVLAGVVSGLCAGKSIGEILALLGNSFVSERALLLFVLTLPAIGVLERAGLREHARNWIASLRSLTFPRLLIPISACARSCRCWDSPTSPDRHRRCGRCWRRWRKPPRKNAARRWMRTNATTCARSAPPPTTSGCSSARTCS